MTTTAASITTIICFVVAVTAAYIAISANTTAEENERKLNEVITLVDRKLTSIENDIRSIRNELAANEQSHGVLSMQIQEISKLSKTEELRKEVLHTREKKI